MEQKSNIIPFPLGKLKSPASNSEEVYESINIARKEHAQAIVEMLMEYMTYKLVDEGFDITQDACDEDFLLVCTGIESLILRSVNIYHPMQELADEFFTLDADLNK